MDLKKSFEDKLWSSMSSFDLGYVPSMALVMANHRLDGTNYGVERPQNCYRWLPRRFKSWHLHRDIHLCLRWKVVLTSVPPIIYKNWSQTRFKIQMREIWKFWFRHFVKHLVDKYLVEDFCQTISR